MSPLEGPPAELAGFPARVVGVDVPLYRIHRADHGPWWFSSSGEGRFDLSGGGSGTCYLAEQAIGAFVEVFRSSTVVPAREVDARRLSRLHLPQPAQVADCTVSEARAFGVTGAIHTTPDYDVARAWAAAFRAGFGGVRYRLSHDPSQQETGIALFGAEAPRSLPVARSDEIGSDLLAEARRRFGLVVAPTPG